MTQVKRKEEEIFQSTLERLRKLYKNNHARPGHLVQVGIKPQWIMVMGSLQECGIASNATGILPADNTPPGSLAITKIQRMVNQPLFEVAATGIQSDNLLE